MYVVCRLLTFVTVLGCCRYVWVLVVSAGTNAKLRYPSWVSPLSDDIFTTPADRATPGFGEFEPLALRHAPASPYRGWLRATALRVGGAWLCVRSC